LLRSETMPQTRRHRFRSVWSRLAGLAVSALLMRCSRGATGFLKGCVDLPRILAA
jgi:hypothetical protein